MNFITEKDVINLIEHNEEIVSKKECLDIIDKQKKEMIDLLNKEIKERILTKKDVIDLIKKEGGKKS